MISDIEILHFRNLQNPKVWSSLSEYSKNRRFQICQVCIKVNFIAWLVEFCGCLTIAIDLLLVGSTYPFASAILRNLTIMCFFILLPCTYLINSSEGINAIVDSTWRDALLRLFMSSEEIENRNRGTRRGNEEVNGS